MKRYFLKYQDNLKTATTSREKVFKVFELLKILDYKHLYKECNYLKRNYSTEYTDRYFYDYRKLKIYKSYLEHKDIVRLNVDYAEIVGREYPYLCFIKTLGIIEFYSYTTKQNPQDIFSNYEEPISLYHFLLEIYFNFRKKVLFVEKCIIKKHKYEVVYEMEDDIGCLQILKCRTCDHYKLNNHLKNI
jgi:hypothetical protein